MNNFLVVDDTYVNRYILLRFLKKYNQNFTVDEASNGEEALRLSQQNNYCIIFMDIKMPGKYNGTQTCSIIKKQNPNQIVVGFSGQIENTQLNVFDYMLEKPISIKDFFSLLEKLHL